MVERYAFERGVIAALELEQKLVLLKFFSSSSNRTEVQ